MTLLLVATAALAVDGHGAPIVPCAPGPAAPSVAWMPGSAERGSWSTCLSMEYARSPLTATVVDAADTETLSLIGSATGLHAGMVYGFGRVGLGVEIPAWLAIDSQPEDSGATLGDARVYLPVGLHRAKVTGALGVDGVAELVLPTGNPEFYVGAGGAGVATHLVLGGQGERLGGSVDLGVGYQGGDTLEGLDTRLWTRLSLAGTWRPSSRVGAGAEVWFQVSPLAGSELLAGSPGEALLHAGFSPWSRLSLDIAGGTAITPGVGAAAARAYLRASYGVGAERAPAVVIEPVVVAPPGPYDVIVSVRDEAGQPVAATILGAGDAPVSTTGGEARLALSPGRFEVTVSADGFATQSRTVDLGDDRFHPERLEVILARPRGEARLDLDVRDREGRPVDGAVVSIDGNPVGATSTGGDLAVTGLATGDRVVTVAHADYRGHGAVPVAITAEGGAASITLDRPPGSVRVVTRGPHGPVPDARIRFLGPEELAPADIGADGERTFTLLPGEWVAVVTANSFGVQEREVRVEAGSTALIVIDVRLSEAEGGTGQLVIRAVDLAGEPLEGVEVLVDGKSAGTTSTGGTLSLGQLAAGERRVSGRGERLREGAEQVVSVAQGTREVLLPMAFQAGQVRVRARGLESAPVDARARWMGPDSLAPTDLGPDGEAWFSLPPGDWTLGVAAPAYGMQERELSVHEADNRRVDVDVNFLSEDGDGTLSVRVIDPEGRPVEGAAVWIDGKRAGTTTGGSVELGGLRRGKHALRVEADGFKIGDTTQAVSGSSRAEVRLSRAARPVTVSVRAGTTPAADALVRVYGAEVFPPAPVDARGERSLGLDPGGYTVVAVSPVYGLGQVEAEVTPGPGTQAVPVPLAAPDPGKGTLLVEVVDPAGSPVGDARLRVDGAEKRLGDAGIAVVDNRDPGPLALAVDAPGYRGEVRDTVDLDEGVQTRRLRLEWLPRPVTVLVVDATGNAVDAEVRALGPGRPAPQRSPGGRAGFSLRPGNWQLIAQAPGYGPFRLDIEVNPGVDPLVVEARLAAERVEMTATSVVIRDQVHFAFDKAEIEARSHAVLDQVAATLLLHPDLSRVEVQGHTDDKGGEAYNLDLSQRRAEAVKAWLVARGVEGARLVARGYGASQPLAQNESEAGRALNRRVQFEFLAEATP